MDNENEELVNRSLYKRIKSMNRAEMENFVRNVFNQGYEKAEEETHSIDYDSLRADLSRIPHDSLYDRCPNVGADRELWGMCRAD